MRDGGLRRRTGWSWSASAASRSARRCSQFPYRDHIVNLLDTPGHKDFSEDTYRVLAGVDAVVMVLDTAKGIEAQTLKLFEVCRSRRLPVLTFLNKYDRPGREPLELLDEIESMIGLRPTPATWPVGIAGDLRGVIDRRHGGYVRYTRTDRGASLAPEEVVPNEVAAAEEGAAWRTAVDEIALLGAVGADVDVASFLAGDSTPVFVGSALTNFGVRMILDAVVDLAPSPSPRVDVDGTPRPLDGPFSAFVFKVQANMDPSHRDRLAFARICSGRFERGMTVTCDRTDRELTTKYATTAFGPDRETVEEAFPGDVVGLVNATGLQLGDTIHAGDAVTYPPIPRFSPEVFATARPLDTGRSKQFRKGLEQLDEEGVVQVLRYPDTTRTRSSPPSGHCSSRCSGIASPASSGHRPKSCRRRYQAIRRTDTASAPRLRDIGGIRILRRSDGELVALFENRYRLARLETDEPELTLEPLVAGASAPG